MRFLWIMLPGLLVACSGSATPEGGSPKPAGDSPQARAQVADMVAAIKSLDASPEHTTEEIEVQHVLISFQGAGVPDVTRSKDEAEILAAEIFVRAKKGEDLTALMKEYSDDAGGGIYPMTLSSRGGMVAGFGNVGWRLQPGMIGVAPYAAGVSPYGWHIIKRLK